MVTACAFCATAEQLSDDMQDQVAALTGLSGAPGPATITAVMLSLLLMNSLVYTSVLHGIYFVALRGLGYDVVSVPSFIRRRLGALV